MKTSYNLVESHFSTKYFKHVIFKFRDIIFGFIFISIFILLLWGTTLKIHDFKETSYHPYTELNQNDVAGGASWEQIRKSSLAEWELEIVKERNRRIPDYYFQDPKNRTAVRAKSVNCAPFPQFTDLVFANQYWQVLETPSSGKLTKYPTEIIKIETFFSSRIGLYS